MSFALGVTDVTSARAGTRQRGQEQRFVMEKIAQVVDGIARWEWSQNWTSLSGLHHHNSNLTASPLPNALCPHIFYYQVVCLYFDDLVPPHIPPHLTTPLPPSSHALHRRFEIVGHKFLGRAAVHDLVSVARPCRRHISGRYSWSCPNYNPQGPPRRTGILCGRKGKERMGGYSHVIHVLLKNWGGYSHMMHVLLCALSLCLRARVRARLRARVRAYARACART